MVKDGQGRPDVLIPAQASGPASRAPWEPTGLSAARPSGARCRVSLPSAPRTDPPSRRGGSPQDGSRPLRPLREDGSICTKTSGVPLPGTRWELRGRTGAPQARHLSGWRRFPQKPGWKWTAASPLSHHTEPSLSVTASQAAPRHGAGLEALRGLLHQVSKPVNSPRPKECVLLAMSKKCPKVRADPEKGLLYL